MIDREGFTALMLAVEKNWVECVRALMPVEAGIWTDVKLINQPCAPVGIVKQSAYLLAAKSNLKECLAAMSEKETEPYRNGYPTLLMIAAAFGDVATVQSRIAKEAGTTVLNGMCALFCAIGNGKYACARHLLDAERGMLPRTLSERIPYIKTRFLNVSNVTEEQFINNCSSFFGTMEVQ